MSTKVSTYSIVLGNTVFSHYDITWPWNLVERRKTSSNGEKYLQPNSKKGRDNFVCRKKRYKGDKDNISLAIDYWFYIL